MQNNSSNKGEENKFRKKPIVIQAWLWDQTKATFKILQENGMKFGGYSSHETLDYVHHLTIQTLEGTMRAEKGDWIIKGINGEFYPCKPDIFEKTYEPDSLPSQPVDVDEIWDEVIHIFNITESPNLIEAFKSKFNINRK